LLNLITFATAKCALNINPVTGTCYCINNINLYSISLLQKSVRRISYLHPTKLLIFNADHATLKISLLKQSIPVLVYDSDALQCNFLLLKGQLRPDALDCNFRWYFPLYYVFTLLRKLQFLF